MIFPNYLKEKDIIGVTACSCGVLSKIDKYEKSIANFSSNGFKIIETDNVRTDGVISSDGVTRARELESLFLDNDVKMVSIARGGDFLYEMLPEVNFDILKNNTKWLSGSSDPLVECGHRRLLLRQHPQRGIPGTADALVCLWCLLSCDAAPRRPESP